MIKPSDYPPRTYIVELPAEYAQEIDWLAALKSMDVRTLIQQLLMHHALRIAESKNSKAPQDQDNWAAYL